MKNQVVLHLVQDVLEDIEVFTSDRDALQHLSAECREQFAGVEDFLDWQQQRQGYPDEYQWLELPEESVRELEDACVR